MNESALASALLPSGFSIRPGHEIAHETVQDDRAAKNKIAKPDGVRRRRSGSDTRKRGHVVFTRLDEEEHARLIAAAANAGLTVSSFIRQAALGVKPPRKDGRATPEQRVAAEVQAELGRIGSNINQLARAANRGPYDTSVHDETLAELKDLTRVLRRIIRSKG